MKNRIVMYMKKFNTCFIALLISAALVAGNMCFALESGPARKLNIYMILWRGETKAEQGFMDYFIKRNIPVSFTIINCDRDKSAIAGIKERIRREKPDLVYSFGTTLTMELAGKVGEVDPAKHITDIPIVFGLVSTPVRSKIVPSLHSSGRNLTGVSHLPPMESQLKAIRDVFTTKRIGVLYNPAEDNSVAQVSSLEELAKKYDFSLVLGAIPLDPDGNPQEDMINQTIADLCSRDLDLIYLPSDSFLLIQAEEVTAEILKNGVPSFAAVEKFLRKGKAFMGLVSNYYSVGSFCGYKAAQILLAGKEPATIPIETLKRFSLIVNMDTANRLSFYPPVDTLMFAEVIGGRAKK